MKLVRFVLVGAMVALGAACALAQDDEEAAMEQVKQQLDRPSGRYEVTRAPAQGQRLTTNPPVFVWLPVEGVRDYVLQYSQDRAFPAEATVTVGMKGTVHTVQTTLPYHTEDGRVVPVAVTYSVPVTTVAALRETLPAGTWYWRYGCDAGSGLVFSEAWEFSIAPDAVAIPFPDIKEVVAKASRARPRLLADAEALPRLRELARTTRRDDIDRLRRRYDSHLGEALLPEPPPIPWGGEWGPAFSKVMRETRQFQGPMVGCAELYLLTGEEKYGLEAKRRLLHLMSWDPNGTTSLGENDEPGHEIVRSAARTYDSIYPLLTDEERALVRTVLAVRIPQLYWALRSNPFEVNPFDSHAMDYFMQDLTEACVAMAGELPVEEWLEYTLTMMWAPFYPPFGGADGGWSEGPSYWSWSTYNFLHGFQLVERFTGAPIHQREWVRNTGYFKLYDNPPYSKLSPFGDGQSYGGVVGVNTMWLLANMLQDPYLAWYAEQQHYSPSGTEAFLLGDKQPAGKAPTDLPQARCFADVGLVAMHSDLAHGERNVSVLLRSSPFGSISHSYADQNAFTLDAFGEPLAIASGYYPYYSSPHHDRWTRQTKAANSIGVDGEGQVTRNWNAKGRITHFETGDYCHYTVGDASAAYGGRLTKFDRHILFLRPQGQEGGAVIIIYDDLASPTASTYQWYLHALEKMETDEQGQRAVIRRGEAQADVYFLAPEGLRFSQTNQFTVPPEGDPERFPNQWHLTAETTGKVNTAHFLTVLLPHRKGQDDPERVVKALTGDGYLGAEIVTHGTRHLVAFRTDPTRRAPLRIGDLLLEEDLAAASWNAQGKLLGETRIRPEPGG
jgi:hypothetical protein